MTIDDEKLDELERCAEAADGPWYRLGLSVVDAHPDCDDDAGPGLVADCFPGDIDEAHSLPAHIAAADPPTVLALVEEVRRLRAEVRELKAYDEGTVVDGTDCCGAETYTSSCLKTGQHRDFCCKCGEVVEDTDE